MAPGNTLYLLRVCLVATLGGLLFGYDTAVISGAIGFLETHFELDATEKGWAAASALAGCIVGAALAGFASERLGRRRTLVIAAILFVISALGTALPRSFGQFIAFRIIGGIGVGAASMTSPMYIAEVSPARLRGRMVSLNQLAIIFGMLVVYIVNYLIAAYGTALDQQGGGAPGEPGWNVLVGWRWMFASEAAPALLLLVLLHSVPESPRWLSRQGRRAEARETLARIGGEAHADEELPQIEAALREERGSLAQLLRPDLRIVLVIGIALAVLQQVTGINVVLYYGPQIFEQTGIATDDALLWTVLVGAVNLAFTLVAIWTVDRVGRRPLMLLGAAGMGIALLALGLSFFFQAAGGWALLLVLGYIACFALSVGPVTWVILSEIFPIGIRGLAMGIATVCLWAANFLVSQTFPMMNEHPELVARFHHGFPFWVYAAFCVALLLFVARVVPETKGRTLEQIERMWDRPRSNLQVSSNRRAVQ